MGDLEKALFGKANGGPISESDFPFILIDLVKTQDVKNQD